MYCESNFIEGYAAICARRHATSESVQGVKVRGTVGHYINYAAPLEGSQYFSYEKTIYTVICGTKTRLLAVFGMNLVVEAFL